MLLLIDAITNTALSHDEQCECVVCRAAAGEEDAFHECVAAHARALNARSSLVDDELG